jgi:CRISPR-associated endonuclease/helicase Cas3
MKANEDGAFLSLARAVGVDRPYDWQLQAFRSLVAGAVPDSIVVPTAAGKTMTIVAFVAALAAQAASGGRVTLPRRLVHVVNRRILVDESTRLAQTLADALEADESLSDVRKALASLSATGVPLIVSTLRGGATDNGAWAQDPTTTSVILATPDMLGSRLLFRGYGLGRSRAATHAGLLACDALIVHDEAHLAPAFTSLLRQVEAKAQAGAHLLNRPAMRVVEMTATLGGQARLNPLVCDVAADVRLSQRMAASKKLSLVNVLETSGKADKPQAAVLDTLVAQCLAHRDTGKAVAVFVSNPAMAGKVVDRLVNGGVKSDRILLLTGTLRGHERAQLTTSNAYRRFDTGPRRVAGEAAYFIATSAGEIGLDIDADAGVFDLTTVDRFIQRCGRVNRRGHEEGLISLVHAKGADLPDAMVSRAIAALGILESLSVVDGWRDASPLALSRLCQHEKYPDAVDPPPAMRTLEPAVLSMLSMTSFRLDEIRCPQPAVYIHGLVDDDAQVGVAWRQLPRAGSDCNAWLDVWPLAPAEVARLPMEAAQKLLQKILFDDERTRVVDGLLAMALDGQGLPVAGGEFSAGQHVYRWIQRIRPGQTVLLASELGGLNKQGLPTADALEPVDDVSALSLAGQPEWPNARMEQLDVRLDVTEEGPVWSAELPELAAGAASGEGLGDWVAGGRIEAPSLDALLAQRQAGFDVLFHDAPASAGRESWLGSVRVWMSGRVVRSADSGDLSSLTQCNRPLQEHLDFTACAAQRIADRLELESRLSETLVRAGAEHDRGKQWAQWQLAIGNDNTQLPLGKSAGSRFNFNVNAGYRHELGSVVDLGEQLGLVQTHLVASHHGWGRPGYRDMALSHRGCLAAAQKVAHGFSALQAAIGPWAVAYLEALLKSADILAEVRADDWLNARDSTTEAFGQGWSPNLPVVTRDTVHVDVDVSNFGEYLAALGLFALLAQTDHSVTAGWTRSGMMLQGVDADQVTPVLSRLCAAKVEAEKAATTAKQAEGTYPPLLLVMPEGFQLPMNHWLEEDLQSSSDWTLGAGKTTALKTLNSLLTACGRSLVHGDFMLRSLFSFGGRKVQANASKFRFDAVTNWSAQDAGFSLNEADTFKSNRPWVELLSALGLQFFFLPPSDTVKRYFVWEGQLSPTLALAAVKGLLPQCTQGYEPVIKPSGKMKDVFTSKLVVRERTQTCQSVIRVI